MMTVPPLRVRSLRQRSGAPRRRLSSAIAVLALASSAVAQSLSLWIGAGAAAQPAGVVEPAGRLALALSDARLADARADAWGRLQLTRASTSETHVDLGAGVALRYTTTFGPLGNVTLEGGGSVASAVDAAAPVLARAWLGARGTLANAAVSVALEAGNAAPSSVDPLRPPPPDEAGRRALHVLDDVRLRSAAEAGDLDLGGRLGVVYRLDRTTTLSVDASLRRVALDPTAALRVGLERTGALAPFDAWLGMEVERIGDAVAGAVAVGVIDAPRRGPLRWLRVYLGAGPDGVAPGLAGRWAAPLAGGDVTLTGEWRPWLRSWRSDVTFDQPIADGTLTWSLAAHGAAGRTSWGAALRWRTAWPLVR